MFNFPNVLEPVRKNKQIYMHASGHARTIHHIPAPPLTPVSTIVSYPHRCSSAGWDGNQGDSDRRGRSGCSHTLRVRRRFCFAYIHLSLLQGGNTQHSSVFMYIYMHACINIYSIYIDVCVHIYLVMFTVVYFLTSLRVSPSDPVTGGGDPDRNRSIKAGDTAVAAGNTPNETV